MWCFNSPFERDETEIVGTRGKITFSTFGTQPITVITSNDEQHFTEEHYNSYLPPHVHQPLIQTIVDELNGDGQCPSSGESGAQTAWVIDQLLASYRASSRFINRAPPA